MKHARVEVNDLMQQGYVYLRPCSLAVVLLACCAQLLPAQTTVFLVRHAEKAHGGDTKDPALSEAGRARAESLAAILKDANLEAIYATEYKRTQETAASAARASGAEVTIVPAKGMPALLEKLKEARGNVLVVGHSNTLPEIIKALGAPAPVTVGEEDYDNLFVLILGSPSRLIRLRYR